MDSFWRGFGCEFEIIYEFSVVVSPKPYLKYLEIEAKINRCQYDLKVVKLTGISEGTEKLPKMLLLKTYRDTIVPDLERKVVK